MKVWYTDASPFARIVRVTLIEFGLEHEAVEMTGFPPAGIEQVTPAWQVPVLEDGAVRLFGTDLIRRYLHETHARDTGDFAAALAREDRRWHDLQVLAAIQAMTEALVAHHYAMWAGTAPQGPNRLGVDPAARNLARAMSLLDWLDAQVDGDGFRPGCFSAQDAALASAILWTEARGPVGWRGRAGLERVIARAGGRPSFAATEPRPRPPLA